MKCLGKSKGFLSLIQHITAYLAPFGFFKNRLAKFYLFYGDIYHTGEINGLATTGLYYRYVWEKAVWFQVYSY